MAYWLLLVWMCNGPGNCAWELRGQYRNANTCQLALNVQERYSVCLRVDVPVPGTPGK